MDTYRIRYSFGQGNIGIAAIVARSSAEAIGLIATRIGAQIKVLECECVNSADTAHVILNHFWS